MTTRTRKTETAGGRPETESAVSGMSIDAMIGWPMDAWLRCQAGMLKATEPLANGWIERRRQGTNAAFDAFEKLAACSDIGQAASVQRAWFEGSMKRLDADLRAFVEHATSLSQEAVAATRQEVETASATRSAPPAPSGRQDETIEQAA